MEKNYKETKCPVCGAVFKSSTRYCPNCGYKKPQSFKIALFGFILISLLLSFFLTKPDTSSNKKEEKKDIVYKEIPLRALSDLNGMNKKEIFEKRISYVNSSCYFNDLKNYQPNTAVFRIENAPWISLEQIAKYGMKNNKNIAKGLSRSSLAINNPELLVSFIVPDYSLQKDKPKITDVDYLLPEKLVYNKEENIIKAVFNIKEYFEKNPELIGSPMIIDETNARDFGYSWFYAKKKKDVKFQNPQNNMSLRPYKVKGEYKLGHSCALKKGCNNYSPYQEELVFGIIDTPSFIEIKMYKQKPKSFRQNADLTYIMSFE